jgi:cobalt-precorrin 5A hydrolase
MAVGEAMMVAGIGCRRGVGADEVLAAIATALDRFATGRAGLDALATAELKLAEEAIALASQRLGLPLRIVGSAELKKAAGTDSISKKALELTGAGSVSEAAALAAAGAGSVLLGPRLVVGPVTCAIAVCGDGK